MKQPTQSVEEIVEEYEEATKMLVKKALKGEESVTTVVTKINFLGNQLRTLTAEREREEIRKKVNWLANHNDANDVMEALEMWNDELQALKDHT